MSEFLGREPYERGEEFRGYRNGYHRSRELMVGTSSVEVPRVSDVPADVSEDGFRLKIVKRYERTSRQTQELFRKLYMEGLSTREFAYESSPALLKSPGAERSVQVARGAGVSHLYALEALVIGTTTL